MADPNVVMYIAWFNTVQKIRIEYKDRTRKFEGTTVYKKDIGDLFLTAINTSMVPERFVLCEFLHGPLQMRN